MVHGIKHMMYIKIANFRLVTQGRHFKMEAAGSSKMPPY
jgi:hypothetical protein